MQNLIKNPTFSLDYDPENDIFIQKWYGDLSENQYKQNMLDMLSLAQKLNQQKPTESYHLVYPNLNFIIPPELQEWTNEHIFSKAVEVGLKKVAFVVPESVMEDIHVEFLSIEQTINEAINTGKRFITYYFSDENKAIEWLKKR